ncbi:MAG TPA: hypothetical protein PLQ48_04920 [Spirochaetota bacterium]|nr:hypothetical protein [Spirochaetota bacterium]
MKKGLKIIIFIPILIYSISEEGFKKFEEANKLFFESKYTEALSIYNNLKEELKGEKLDSLDKSIKQIIQETISDINFLMAIKDITNYIIEARNLENIKTQDSVLKYIEIKNIAKAKGINKVPYIDYIINGNIDKYLKDKLSKKIENLNPNFANQIEKDKKRKKSIGFYAFKKDPSIDFDFQQIIIDNLLNLLERKRVINIQEKIFTGEWEKVLNEAKTKNIDFILTGEYKKVNEEVISFNMYIVDSFLDKKLIEANIVMPLTKEFFYSLDQIIAIIEKNLLNYSRLEDFKTISLSKKGEGKLIQDIKEEIKEESLINYIDLKIKTIINNYIEKQLAFDKEEKEENIISRFNQVSEFIDNYNKIENIENIENPILKDENRNNLKSVIKKSISKNYNKMKNAIENIEYYDDFYEYYNDVIKDLDYIDNKYKYITFATKEIREEIEKEKNEFERIVSNIEKINFDRLAIETRVGEYTPKKEEIITVYSLDKHSFTGLGLTYERRIYRDIWSIYGVYFNINQISIHELLGENTRYYQLIPSIIIGFKFYPIGNLFLTDSLEFNFPIENKKDFQQKAPNVMMKLGLGYDIIDNLNIGINFGYYGSGIEYKNKTTGYTIKTYTPLNLNSVDIFAKYYFWSDEKFNILDKKYSENIWTSLIAEYSFLKIRIDLEGTYTGSESLQSLGGGIGITYYINKRIGLGFDIMYTQFTHGESWQEYATTKTLNINLKELYIGINSQVTMFNLYGISFVLMPKIGLKTFIEKSIKFSEYSNVTDITDSINRNYIEISLLTAGLAFDISDTSRIITTVEKPVLIPDKESLEHNVKFNLKLEFSL